MIWRLLPKERWHDLECVDWHLNRLRGLPLAHHTGGDEPKLALSRLACGCCRKSILSHTWPVLKADSPELKQKSRLKKQIEIWIVH